MLSLLIDNFEEKKKIPPPPLPLTHESKAYLLRERMSI